MSSLVLVAVFIACAVAVPYTGQAINPDGSLGWGIVPFAALIGTCIYGIWTWYGGWALVQLAIIGAFGAFGLWLAGDIPEAGPRRASVLIFSFFGWVFAYVVTTKFAKLMDSRQSDPGTPEGQ